jgi:hypothetical protein
VNFKGPGVPKRLSATPVSVNSIVDPQSKHAALATSAVSSTAFGNAIRIRNAAGSLGHLSQWV